MLVDEHFIHTGCCMNYVKSNNDLARNVNIAKKTSNSLTIVVEHELQL